MANKSQITSGQRAAPSGLNQVRINAGQWRSRLLRFPDVPGLRPTPDRVRQTLFNWLGQDLTGKHCLDLFAGTGVMGFEALSRGAASVVMVEKSAIACQALHKNQQLLMAQHAKILQQDAMIFLNQNHQKFDVIFADPPYQQGWLDKILPALPLHIAENGLVYVEAEYQLAEISGWQTRKHGKAGQVFYHLLQASV